MWSLSLSLKLWVYKLWLALIGMLPCLNPPSSCIIVLVVVLLLFPPYPCFTLSLCLTLSDISDYRTEYSDIWLARHISQLQGIHNQPSYLAGPLSLKYSFQHTVTKQTKKWMSLIFCIKYKNVWANPFWQNTKRKDAQSRVTWMDFSVPTFFFFFPSC